MALCLFAPLLCSRLQLVFAESGYCSTPMISPSFLALVPNTSSCLIGTLYPYPFIFDVSGSLPEWLAAPAEFDSVDDGRLSLSETNFGAFKAYPHNRSWFSALHPTSRDETPDVPSITLKTSVDAIATTSVPTLEPPGNLTLLGEFVLSFQTMTRPTAIAACTSLGQERDWSSVAHCRGPSASGTPVPAWPPLRLGPRATMLPISSWRSTTAAAIISSSVGMTKGPLRLCCCFLFPPPSRWTKGLTRML